MGELTNDEKLILLRYRIDRDWERAKRRLYLITEKLWNDLAASEDDADEAACLARSMKSTISELIDEILMISTDDADAEEE